MLKAEPVEVEAFFPHLQGIYLAVYIHGKQMLLVKFIRNILWYLEGYGAELFDLYHSLSLPLYIHSNRNIKEHFLVLQLLLTPSNEITPFPTTFSAFLNSFKDVQSIRYFVSVISSFTTFSQCYGILVSYEKTA